MNVDGKQTKEELAKRFERGLALRDADDLRGALAVLEDLVPLLREAGEMALLVHTYMQLAYVHKQLGDMVQREKVARKAAKLAPRFELASLVWFNALIAVGEGNAAIQEMLRFLRLQHSPGYAEALDELEAQTLTSEQRRWCDEARALIVKRS